MKLSPLRDPAQKDGGTEREVPERIVYAGAQVLQLIHADRANASKAVEDASDFAERFALGIFVLVGKLLSSRHL
jgi:hypothetical protein